MILHFSILHVWYDELTDVLKDKGILIFILFVPLFYPVLYAYIYTNEVVRDIPIAVIDDSKTNMSRLFLRNVDASPDVAVYQFCTDMSEAQDLVRRHKVYGIVRIPQSFADDIFRGDQTYVGFYGDMSSMLYYKGILLAVTNVSLEMNKSIKIERHIPSSTNREEEINKTPIKYNYIAMFNPQSGFASFLVPAVFMLIFQQTQIGRAHV